VRGVVSPNPSGVNPTNPLKTTAAEQSLMVRHSTFSLVAVRLCEMCDPDPPDLTVSLFLY
jgi:hypothetical protein